MGGALLEASPKQLVATGCFMGLISHAHSQTITSTTITSTVWVPEFQYFSGRWSSCSPQCGRGTRSREVHCIRTCSVYGLYCPKADEAECSWEGVRPADSEDCLGPPCPEATTVTATVPITSTRVTSTVTTTGAVASEVVCLPIFGGDRSSCLPQAEAALRCRAGCPCCQLLQQQNDGGSGASNTTALPDGSGGGGSSANDAGPQITVARPADDSSSIIIVAVASACAVIALVLALLWWRSCVRRAEISRALREKYAKNDKERGMDAATQAANEKQRTTSFRTKRPPTTKAEDGTIFDTNLGAGVPSAPPEGYQFNEPSDAEEGRAGGTWEAQQEGPTSKNRSKFKANRDTHWRSSEQPDVGATATESGTNRSDGRQRRADKSEDSDECLTPPSGSPRSKQPQSGSATLPPGFAAASRAQRRAGKDSLDPSSFAGAQEPPPQMPGQEPPPQMPGQADAESEETRTGTAGNSGSSNPRRGMATPPRANEDDSQNKKTKESKRSAPGADSSGNSADADAGGSPSGSAPGGGAGSNREEEDDDPRVAKETAASAAAADLIAKVDRELDEALTKDLETRRKIFKALILHWHPDKNQEEERATEVFRYLMARRTRYLQEG